MVWQRPNMYFATYNFLIIIIIVLDYDKTITYKFKV